MSSLQQIERTNLLPPALAERGWKLYERESASPYRADNEFLGLYTGGFPSVEDAIDKANELTVEEDERQAIAGDGATPEELTLPGVTIEPGGQSLSLDVIRTDGGTQPRSALDMLVVGDYKEAMLEGAEFPPIVVFFDGKNLWLADGFHRLQAQKEARVSSGSPRFDLILSEVRLGTQRDALLYALGANATHGLPRSREDKRRAVTMMLEDSEWSTFSDSAIAVKVNVSQPFVSKLRRELTSQNVLSEQPVRRGTDGVTRDTTNIGGHSEQEENESQPSFNQVAPALFTAEATADVLPSAPDDDDVAAAPELEAAEVETSESRETVASTYSLESTREIVEALSRHGGVLMRMQIEEMGISYAAIHNALGEGAIIQPETGKFTLPDHKPQPSSGAAPTTTRPDSSLPRASIDELLKGRKLSISFVWIPALKGKVNVTVNAGDKPETAVRQLVDSDRVRGFHADVQKMIVDQLNGVKPTASTSAKVIKKKPAAAKSKKPAKASRPAPAKKKPATKKKAAAKGRKR